MPHCHFEQSECVWQSLYADDVWWKIIKKDKKEEKQGGESYH